MIALSRQFTETTTHFPHRWECDCDGARDNGNDSSMRIAGKSQRILLGRYNDSGELEIKRHQLWIYIEGGRVAITCWRCGRQHVWSRDLIH